MKRGQVSIFLLVGILLLLFVGFFMFYRSLDTSSTLQVVESTDESPVEQFVEGCLEQVGEQGVNYLSHQGGYYETPDPSYNFSYYTLPYYYIDNTSYVPSLEVVEEEFAIFIEDKMIACIDDFSTLAEQGYSIDAGSIRASVVLEDAFVDIALDYPLTITADDAITSLDTFSVRIATDMGYAHAIASEIVGLHDDDSSMPLSKITRLSEDEEIFITMGHLNSTVVYAVDIPQEETQEQYLFEFAIYYAWGDLNSI